MKEGIYPFYSFYFCFRNALKRSCRRTYGEGVWSDSWKGNLWEQGCHKRKGAGFLISQHIRPCCSPMQPVDNPDLALKRRNQTNLPLGIKVRFLGTAPLLEEWSGIVVVGWCLSAAQMLHQQWNHL